MIRIKSAAELQLAPQKCPDWLSKRAGNGYPCAETFRDTFGLKLEPWMYDEFDVSGITENDSALDTQIGGNHYKGMAIQPLEFCAANMTKEEVIGVIKKDVLAYLFRDKNDMVEDWEKARHTLAWGIETLKGKQ